MTTSLRRREEAAAEARKCIRDGGGIYFRRFQHRPRVKPGDRVYYVEAGYVRGFCDVLAVELYSHVVSRRTTGRLFECGWYLMMDAATWKWIRPIPMKGFRAYRYAKGRLARHERNRGPGMHVVRIVGGWRDLMPLVKGEKPS